MTQIEGDVLFEVLAVTYISLIEWNATEGGNSKLLIVSWV